MQEHYEYAAIIDFDDAAGLKAYLAHPAHEELSQQFYATVERSLAYDYELLEGTEGIAGLLGGSRV